MWGWVVCEAAVIYAQACRDACEARRYEYAIAVPKAKPVQNCPCCGARQFIYKPDRRICAYCGSDQ